MRKQSSFDAWSAAGLLIRLKMIADSNPWLSAKAPNLRRWIRMDEGQRRMFTEFCKLADETARERDAR